MTYLLVLVVGETAATVNLSVNTILNEWSDAMCWYLDKNNSWVSNFNFSFHGGNVTIVTIRHDAATVVGCNFGDLFRHNH